MGADLLITIAHILTTEADLTEALRLVVREVVRFVGAETGAAYRVDRVRRVLVPVAAYRVPKHALEILMAAVVPIDEQGFRESVFAGASVTSSDDVQNDPRFTFELFHRFPHRSAVIVPFHVDAEVAGALYLVWWERAERVDLARVSMLEAVGQQLALLLRAAWLRAETRAPARRGGHRRGALSQPGRAHPGRHLPDHAERPDPGRQPSDGRDAEVPEPRSLARQQRRIAVRQPRRPRTGPPRAGRRRSHPRFSRGAPDERRRHRVGPDECSRAARRRSRVLGRHDRGHHQPPPRRRSRAPRRDLARRRSARQRGRARDQQSAVRHRRPARAPAPGSHAGAAGPAGPVRRRVEADRQDHRSHGAAHAARDARRPPGIADARSAAIVRDAEAVGDARQLVGASDGSLKKLPVKTTELGKTTTRPVGLSGSPASSRSLIRTNPISAASPCTYPNGPWRLTRSPTRIPLGATIVK